MNGRGRTPLERLPPVPHDGAEEAEVGGRQRSAEEGELVIVRIVGGVAVRIIDDDKRELRGGGVGHGDAHADETFGQQHAVRLAPRSERRDVGERRIGSVIDPEDRVGAAGRGEARLDAGRAHRHVVVGLMAGDAPPPIDAQVEEERVVVGDDRKARDVDRSCLTGFVLRVGDAPLRAILARNRSREEQAGDRRKNENDRPSTLVAHHTSSHLARVGSN
jgi:hypothetical protein